MSNLYKILNGHNSKILKDEITKIQKQCNL